jgi:ABC-2 type transport system permease protein
VVATLAITVVVGVATAGSIDISRCPTPRACPEDTTKLALTGVWLGQVAVVVLAGLTMTSEYSTRMIHSTFLANPRRIQVLTAKAGVVALTVVAAGTLSVLASLIVGEFVLRANGLTPENGYQPLSLSDAPTLRAAAGTVLYLALIALFSLGVATAIRDTAGAITAVLGMLFAFPILAQLVGDPQWSKWLGRLAPMTAGLSVQATRGLRSLPIGPWAGLGVVAAYAAAALLLGGILLRVRDA